MLIEAELHDPFLGNCGADDRGWKQEAAQVAAAEMADAAELRGATCAARPNFNDPLVRSLPIWSLAIALAIMENGTAPVA